MSLHRVVAKTISLLAALVEDDRATAMRTLTGLFGTGGTTPTLGPAAHAQRVDAGRRRAAVAHRSGGLFAPPETQSGTSGPAGLRTSGLPADPLVCAPADDQRTTSGPASSAAGAEGGLEGGVRALALASPASKAAQSKGKTVEQETSAAFLAFWTLYPRKRDRARSALAYARAVARSDAQTIIDGLIAQAPGMRERIAQGEGDKVPHPTTWLNNDRWEREFAESLSVNGYAGGRKPLISSAMRASMAPRP